MHALPSLFASQTRPSAVVNFRDLGRYQNSSRVPLRSMTVFRSATLSHLEAGDVEAFRHLGIQTVIDLRTSEEQELDGTVPESVGATLRSIPMLASIKSPTGSDDSESYFAAQYIEMFLERTPALAEVIETIVREPGPVVFHCMAGKDRTGVVAATILDLVGVADATILHDYALSEAEMPSLRALFVDRFPDRAVPLAPAMFERAPTRALAQAIDVVRCERGSIQQLLRDAGLTLGAISALRVRLLQR